MNLSIDHGPWLTNPDIGKITIGFSSAEPCAAAVEYRTGSSPWQKIYQSEGGQIVRAERRHIFHLSGLVPGAEYEFRAVVFDPNTDEENSAAGKFTVFDPARKNYSFLVLADLQFAPEKRLEIAVSSELFVSFCNPLTGILSSISLYIGILTARNTVFKSDALARTIKRKNHRVNTPFDFRFLHTAPPARCIVFGL